MFHPPGWRSGYSVRLVGFDPSAVPTEWGSPDEPVPGWARVTGVWQDDTITVTAQTTFSNSGGRLRSFVPPCQPPAGGWDLDESVNEIPELEWLRSSGAVLGDQWLREPGGARVLIVAATDVDAVTGVLGSLLPRRVCVVASRFGAAHVREVRSVFAARAREWGFEFWSSGSLDEAGQPYAHASLLRVTDQLASWVDTLPEGLITLAPSITPA
jgi:hypothetical protein